MRNASHRSICRLRRAARRVGGFGRGWQAETPAGGRPVPSSTPKLPLEKPLNLEPLLGHSLPHSSSVQPHPTYHFLLHLRVSTWPGEAWVLCTPLSTCLIWLAVSLCVCLSFSVCVLGVPICLSMSVCPSSALLSVSACTSFSWLLYISLL